MVLQAVAALQFVRKNRKHGERDYKTLFSSYGIGNDAGADPGC